LVGACGVCGEPSPDPARFCSACGSRLEAEPTARRGVRRSVTILFVDIAGFTSLAEQVDAELLRAVSQRYFETVREVVERHGGTVEKFIGDAVMAAFGVPILHEDDALRAVRAASEIAPRLTVLDAELRAATGRSIQVRIGVNTGEVIAGDPAAGASFVTGDAVNVAARLEQAAQPGEVLLGPTTYRLVRNQIVADDLPALSLKGKTDQLEVHRLRSVAEVAADVPQTRAAPLIGREPELHALRRAHAKAVTERRAQLVTVVGPAGIGKSRLVAEFAGGLPETRVLKGRCLPYGEGITYWPIAEIVRGAAAITEADTREQALARLHTLMAGDPDGPLVAARVASATGIEPGGAAHEELRWAIRRFLAQVAQDRPLFVIIEDIHWAEPTLLDVIEHVVGQDAEMPMVVACPARPDLYERRPTWANGLVNSRTVFLDGLEAEQADRLLLEIPGGAALPGPVRERLLDLAGGNPLFLEEIVGRFVETGDLRSGGGQWTWVGPSTEVFVPPTVEALVAGRVEALPQDLQLVLERAAVIGRAFDEHSVAEMMESEPGVRVDLGGAIASLLGKRLIQEDRPLATRSGQAVRSFRFRHQLIRDGAYARLPKSDRAQLHERYGEWLERGAGDRIAELEEIVGYHFEVASRYRQELGLTEQARRLGERAAMHLAVAARRAFDRFDLSAAANLGGRAASLLARGDPERIHLLLVVAQASHHLGDYSAAESTVREATDEAAEAHLVRESAWARIRGLLLQSHLNRPGFGDEVLHAVDEVVPAFMEASDEVGLSVAFRSRASTLWNRGDTVGGDAAARLAVEHAERSGDPTALGKALITWAMAGNAGDHTVQETINRANVVLARLPGQLRVEAEMRSLLADMLSRRLKFAEGRRQSDRALTVARDLNVPWLLAGTRTQRGFLELTAGNVKASIGEFEAALGIYRATDDAEGIPYTSSGLAEALETQQRDDEALAMAELTAKASNGNQPVPELIASLTRAMVLARRGLTDEASAVADEAFRSTESMADPWLRAFIALKRAIVLSRTGQVVAAQAAALDALERARAKGDLALARDAGRLLKELELRPARGTS
jgi:class 3 adenylate cyclase/tetratricopeptide (TPR) repeat protein